MGRIHFAFILQLMRCENRALCPGHHTCVQNWFLLYQLTTLYVYITTSYQYLSRKNLQNTDGYSISCNEFAGWVLWVRGTYLVLHVSRIGPSLAPHRRKAFLLQATSCQKWTTCQCVGEANFSVEQEIQRTSLFFDSGRNQIRFKLDCKLRVHWA